MPDGRNRTTAHAIRQPTLALRDASFAHGDRNIVDRFNLSVEPGEHHLLIGRSGSGKSTLINLVRGFLRPDSGTIRVSGELISDGSETARDAIRRAHLGVVFQSLRLVSALSLENNLSLAAKLAGKPVAPSEVSSLLHDLGIAELSAKRPYQLSQGEAQRAAIARALIVKPALLIADEPTSALDQDNAEAVAEMFLRQAEQHGTTLLIATHDTRLRAYFRNVVELESQNSEVVA